MVTKWTVRDGRKDVVIAVTLAFGISDIDVTPAAVGDLRDAAPAKIRNQRQMIANRRRLGRIIRSTISARQ